MKTKLPERDLNMCLINLSCVHILAISKYKPRKIYKNYFLRKIIINISDRYNSQRSSAERLSLISETS